MANKNNNKSIDVSYVFPETISKKSGDLYSKVPGIDELTIYEEPRWSFKDHLNNGVMNYLKENDNDLYEEIIEYQKEHPDGFYFDVGKSLRYDDLLFWWQGGDCSLETLEDKLDDLFIVRYSSEGLDGNLGNPDEIHISDEKLVSKLNSMIKEHVQYNIDRYNEYKKIRSELVDKELADKHNNALDVYYEKDLKEYTDYAPLPEKTNPENQIIRVQEGQLTTELEVLLDLNKEGDLTHNFGWFKYAELDKNGVLVKDYPVGIWDQRQDEKGNPLNPPKIDTKDISQVIFSKELREKIDSNLKEKIDEVSQTLMRENFENNIRNGKFTDFNAGKVVESMKNETFKEFETIGSFAAGNCNFNLWITKGGVPEEPWIDISPVRTIGGTDINGTVSLSLSDIMEPTETLSVEEQIKNTIFRKIDELDSPEDTQKTILTVLGKNYDELNKNKNWVWKDYDDLSGHLVSPDGKSYFSYDWTTKEYKTTPESSWDSFIDADPERDTSLSAFKNYAEKFVRNNIAKDNDIVFERKYIDTSKEMKGEIMSNETLADKYMRMNKLFEERKSREGSGNPMSFEELYKWTEEEFPTKDSSEVLKETVGRMIMDNVSHEEFNVEYYDDVYGFGDGADFRWDLSFKAADALLSGDVLSLSDAQKLIYKESKKMFEELKQNPNYKNEIELTDRINAAFRISEQLYPEFAKLYEHDVAEDSFYNYTSNDKKAYIEKVWETLKNEFDNKHVTQNEVRNDLLIIEDITGTKELLLTDLVSLNIGRDAVLDGKESLTYTRPNAEQLQIGIENGWGWKEFSTGYGVFQDNDYAFEGHLTPEYIAKIDDMEVFESDREAALQWEKDTPNVLMKEREGMWIGDENYEFYNFPDTPENRTIMKEAGWLLEQPLTFNWSGFTEEKFNILKREIESGRIREDYKGEIHIGSISADLTVYEQEEGFVSTDYYIAAEEGDGEMFDDIPYGEESEGITIPFSVFKENDYEGFKKMFENNILNHFAEDEHLKREASRPLVDWGNEEQVKELYHTKLIESAKLNEIVIAPYSRDKRDVETVRDFVSNIINLPAIGVPDDMVFAVLDNIGRVQDDKPGDFLKVKKDGSLVYIKGEENVTLTKPIDIIHEISTFAEEHAALAEEGSEQKKDFEYIKIISEKVAEPIINPKLNPTEYVLKKLKEKGIEVVTDKAEFDRILKSQNILQKMEASSDEENNPLFLADEKELKAFAQKVDDWKAGNLKPTEVISEFSTSTVLQAINIPANKVSIDQLVLKKINALETEKVGNSYGHDIDIETIKKIPQYLSDPIMVYNSASRKESYTVLTEAIDKNKESILIALQINKFEDGIYVNNITSAYGKDENEWFIEQIKLGNLVYQDKKRSLEWTNHRRLSLPNQMTTQGSLNVIQKEDIVNKRTVNFDLNERKIEFTENQQHFLKSIGFENSLNEDGSLSKSSFVIKNTEGKKNFLKIALNVNNNTAIFVKNEEAVDDFLIYDNSHKSFIEFSMIEEANANEPLVPAEALGKVLSDYALDRLVSEDVELMEESFSNKPDSIFVKDNLKKQLEEISFKNKVVNLPAKFISEDIYSSGINPIGKELTFKVYKEVLKIAGVRVDDKKHYLLKFQTNNNYEYVHNKDYPRLYEAKWDRKSQSYTNVVELDLSNFDSKTIGNIQYIAANNCNYPNLPAQTMTLSDGKTYGFAYEGKIYLNPDIMNSEVAVHEYTHLWDNLTRKENPELWNKGLQIFKGTSIWNEVVNDENYADIKDDENLVLSECHARITGKVAEEVLRRISEMDGTAKQADMIDWDRKTIDFIYANYRDVFAKNGFETVAEFAAASMKELFNPNREIDSYKESINYIKEQLEKESGIKVNERLVDEIYSQYEERDLQLEPFDNGLFRITDTIDGKYTNLINIQDVVKQVIAWDDKELSELHDGTGDDEEIKKIKDYIEDLEHVNEQIVYSHALSNLDFNNKEDCQKVKEMLGDDFKLTDEEAKVLLTYATHLDDGTHEYGLSKDGHLHFRTNQDNEGWSFLTEDSMQLDFLTSAFDGAAILLDSDRSNDIDLLNSFLQKNESLLNELDNNRFYTSSLKDVKEKLKENNVETKEFTVTHSVTFPCGFIYPDSVGKTEREMNNYRKKVYKKLQEKYGFNDNYAETSHWTMKNPKDSSFNINFTVSVPEDIKTDENKVNAWIDEVEKFTKEECGCTFINWEGGERFEQTYINEKQYRMQQERKKEFSNPDAENLEPTSTQDIKDYCRFNSQIELTDEQVKEICTFYDYNDQYGLYVSPAGNLYVRDEYEDKIVSADAELLKAGNNLRTLEGKERLDYLLHNISDDEEEWSKALLDQLSNDSDERLRIVSDVLSESFATLDRHYSFWNVLLDYGADPTRAIRIAAEDANLGDNLNWLLNSVPESQIKQIFSDNGYADAVFDIAKESVTHDMDSWIGGHDIGFTGFKQIARLCGREADADHYYGDLLEKAFEYPVGPKIVQLLDTPELLADKMNNSKVHPNEPTISRDQASSILDYCNYEDIIFYVAKDGKVYSLDVSEDYNGEGLEESNFGIVTNGIEYARKARELDYSCYSTDSFNIVSDLWQKERQFFNPSLENKKNTFTDDIDKMRDFDSLSKDEFLASYSYLTEEEYDATLRELKENNLTGMKMVEKLQAQEKTLSETETQLPADSKEPVEIIKEIATQKELAEVPELFTNEFKNRMKTRLPGPEKDPFIVAKAIINDWKTSKPDYIPALNKWLSDSLKKEGFTTKEDLERGFEKFFKKLSSSEQKRMQQMDFGIGEGR